MNCGRVEERSSSRSRSPSTARRAATSAILTDILSKSDRAQTSHTVNARPGWSVEFKEASSHERTADPGRPIHLIGSSHAFNRPEQPLPVTTHHCQRQLFL